MARPLGRYARKAKKLGQLPVFSMFKEKNRRLARVISRLLLAKVSRPPVCLDTITVTRASASRESVLAAKTILCSPAAAAWGTMTVRGMMASSPGARFLAAGTLKSSQKGGSSALKLAC